jgi:hypothetical protein
MGQPLQQLDYGAVWPLDEDRAQTEIHVIDPRHDFDAVPLDVRIAKR